MKKYLTISLFILSCAENKSVAPSIGTTKIVAVYVKHDSSKMLDVLLRVITKAVVYDSIKQKDIISVDTLWGYPILVPLRDSNGIVLQDSLKRPIQGIDYRQIRKDSVNWKIQNIPFDTLIKK